MTPLDKSIHDARKPLNAISMQAELIKMLAERYDDNQAIMNAATKIIEHSKSCSESLQQLSQDV